ncbi:MAG TPA: bifunctional diguanylate cyclase/phosphodiesterase [Euzebyales bacterium]|nr:bifunctional diguanylate cyclase/phosphodiesterase [Euzebyales bacterium]
MGGGLALLLLLRIMFGDGAVGEAAYLVATLSGAALAWSGAGRLPGAARRTWRVIGAGLAMSAVGDLTYSGYLWTAGEVPGASLADVGWLGCYVLLAVGVFRLAGATRTRAAGDVDALLDAAAVGIVALIVVWYASIRVIVGDASTPAFVRVVWAAYPILDAVLLALAVRLLLGGVPRRSMVLLATGVGCWLVADFAYVLWAAEGTYGVSLELAWMVGPVLIGAAAWSPVHRGTPPAGGTGSVGAARLMLLTVPILVPNVIDIWGNAQGFDPDPVLLLAVTTTLASLVYVRAWRLLTANARARSALRSRQRYFEALAANSSDASLVVDRDGRLATDWVVPEPLRSGGAAASGLRGVDATELLGWASPEGFRRLLDRARDLAGIATSQELGYVDAAGRSRWMLVRACDLTSDPDVRGVVLNLHDVTERKEIEQALEHRALHDALTGLPNRVLLRDRVEQALRRADRNQRTIAVAYLDLDGFKRVNDSLGHDAGDELLRRVAHRLTASVRPADTVARLGGDEFAILIEDVADDAVTQIVDRVVRELGAPVRLDERPVVAPASVGLAVSERDATAMSLLRDADVAMYRAKAIGGNQWVRYEPQMRTLVEEQLRLEADLVTALGDDQFELLYQPVMQLETNTVVGFEALLRWHHPELGLITPDRFIPIAERTGLIEPIGRWVLETACGTLAGWRGRDRRGLTMAVNVSGRQLASDRFVADVAAVIERTGVSADRVVLEMTETVLVEDVAGVGVRLQELRELGVRLAIDDFGTGYSSLGYLRQFPIDILKIDQSFVNTIVEPGAVPPIVRGLLDLAATLQLETVAEGIELEVQHEQLRDGRCEMGQGYLFARPMPFDEADRIVAALSVASEDVGRAPPKQVAPVHGRDR